MLQIILPILLFLTSVFLILIVLIQRGRGGGLAGAFGGMGGQSAFGTKAGDLFTRITIVTATFWIILCAASVQVLNTGDAGLLDESLGGAAAPTQNLPPGTGTKAAETPATSGTGETPATGEAPATGGAAAASSETPAGESAAAGDTETPAAETSEKNK